MTPQDPRYGQSQTVKVFENDLIKLERAQKALLCEQVELLKDIKNSTASTPPTPELDALFTNWIPFCIEGIQYYSSEQYTVDNTTGLPTLVGKLYKTNANGTILNIAPVGVVQDGLCVQGTNKCVTCRNNI